MANLALKRIGKFMIVVQNKETPLTEEWNLLIQQSAELAIEGGDISNSSTVIFTDGGAPDSKQRLALAAELKGKPAPSVVISDNMMVRGIVGVVALFNKGISAYSSKEWKKAFTAAKVPEAQQLEFLSIAIKLAREVGGCNVLKAIGL